MSITCLLPKVNEVPYGMGCFPQMEIAVGQITNKFMSGGAMNVSLQHCSLSRAYSQSTEAHMLGEGLMTSIIHHKSLLRGSSRSLSPG